MAKDTKPGAQVPKPDEPVRKTFKSLTHCLNYCNKGYKKELKQTCLSSCHETFKKEIIKASRPQKR